MDRREFLKSASLASTAFLVPQFLQGMNLAGSANKHRSLVIIQLSGGNDGLNTVVPYRNDIYYKARPKLALDVKEILKVHDELGFHDSLPELASLYDHGYLSVINNVGYPDPDRSHFRSMDIWHTASGSNETWRSGWLGRYLDGFKDGSPTTALEVNESLGLALKGENKKGLAAKRPEVLYRTTQHPFIQKMNNVHDHHEQASYLYKTLNQATSSAQYLYEKSKLYPSRAEYPDHQFANELKLVAQLINAGTNTQIYYVSLDGFDTHAFQKPTQNRLLQQYSKSIRAFIDDLRHGNKLDDTLIMTFSEFGRRVEQNASGGTDHGAASNVFLMGGKIKKAGFYNEAPDLTDLQQGDLKHSVDFRQIYATIIDKWLGADSKKILKKDFATLDFI